MVDKLLTLVGVDSADQLTEAQLKVRASRGVHEGTLYAKQSKARLVSPAGLSGSTYV